MARIAGDLWIAIRLISYQEYPSQSERSGNAVLAVIIHLAFAESNAVPEGDLIDDLDVGRTFDSDAFIGCFV